MKNVLFHKITNKYFANTEGVYAPVAIFSDSIGDVFEATQNMFSENGWARSNKIQAFGGEFRSTCVGDVYCDGTDVTMVDSFGYESITGEDAERFLEMTKEILAEYNRR